MTCITQQPRAGERQSQHWPVVLHGRFPGSFGTFAGAATFLARSIALLRSGQTFLELASRNTRFPTTYVSAATRFPRPSMFTSSPVSEMPFTLER